MKPYALLQKVLDAVEAQIHETLGVDDLAAAVEISPVHLQRIFKFAFGITLASYVRARKLSASVEKLLIADFNILDIACEFGFEYEQSYIRAFKREFGITPGGLRKTGRIVKVTPPLQLFDSSKVTNGILFGPDIVMVPQFHVIGKRHQIPFSDSVELPPRVAKQFWHYERSLIKNAVTPNVYIGLTRFPDLDTDWSYYLPSVQVKGLDEIPQGLYGDTFASSMCARFHYIGQHHYYDINADVARSMYDAIIAFANDENAKYRPLAQNVYFEKIDTLAYDGTYCQMEWFTPVFEKMNAK
ncbi:MAG TPA: AraC family transcriptional regulator [Clostridia bacterium]|nr:AraC family transcriptional regulator [Clostridia bacterium]